MAGQVKQSKTIATNATVLFTILRFSTLTFAASVPEEWPYVTILDARYNIAVNAFINVTQVIDDKWVQFGEVEENGRYGTGYIGPTKGVLVHISSITNYDDHTGCRLPFTSRTDGSFPEHKPWIALIRRGECNFDTKIINAYDSGAHGVIIYNNVDRDVLEVMSLSHNRRNCWPCLCKNCISVSTGALSG